MADASLFTIRNEKAGYQFLMEGGLAGDTPGTPWSLMSSDGPNGGLRVSKSLQNNIKVEGYPCPDGFPSPCVHLDPEPGAISLKPCDGSKRQLWNLTGTDPSVVTNVQSHASRSCWEINGCNGPDVDTNHGCKKEPLPLQRVLQHGLAIQCQWKHNIRHESQPVLASINGRQYHCFCW